MSTKSADARKMPDPDEILRIIKSGYERSLAKSAEAEKIDRRLREEAVLMDRRLRQVKWFLAFMVPITLLMLAY